MTFVSSGRMKREARTIQAMIRLYCRKHHGGGARLCPQCLELEEYAGKRLAACPFQEDKTTCGNCPIHCYKPGMRERVRTVMREIGPKMIFHHPLMALRHLIDSLRKTPKKKRG
ncbi:MAG: nitrous oxide-stimulated promoter family protein [Proteobacteria bacterium]|nr:nitrous oxide-stimulated promoter family protein [Pseudomonadota bacterium]MBU1640726.1 nitrous oxide-stimulated promoter family protein [Pseudomonadota bacterium]